MESQASKLLGMQKTSRSQINGYAGAIPTQNSIYLMCKTHNNNFRTKKVYVRACVSFNNSYVCVERVSVRL